MLSANYILIKKKTYFVSSLPKTILLTASVLELFVTRPRQVIELRLEELSMALKHTVQ